MKHNIMIKKETSLDKNNEKFILIVELFIKTDDEGFIPKEFRGKFGLMDYYNLTYESGYLENIEDVKYRILTHKYYFNNLSDLIDFYKRIDDMIICKLKELKNNYENLILQLPKTTIKTYKI